MRKQSLEGLVFHHARQLQLDIVVDALLVKSIHQLPGGRRGRGGGLLGSIFAGYVPLVLQILWPVIDSFLVTFGHICNFRDPNLVTFYLCMYLTLNKNTLLFTYGTNILVCLLTVYVKNCLTPKIKIPYSNSIENATP